MRVHAGLGPVLVLTVALNASCGSSGPTSPTPESPLVPAGLSPTVTVMLQTVGSQIVQFVLQNEAQRPLNPGLVPLIDAKIVMLRRPGLAGDIVNDRRFAERTVGSIDGRSRAIVAVFPEASMRPDAERAVDLLGQYLPHLEQFMDVAFPLNAIRVWYGFKLGATGGGGILDIEDRQTYEGRPNTGQLPLDAIIAHELAHNYVGNEGLTQFLEMYLYNINRGASVEVSTWTHTRAYVPALASNSDGAALLDIYRLIGLPAMRRSYRRLYPFRPPYGSALSPDVRQVFVDEAPEAVRSEVAASISRVLF